MTNSGGFEVQVLVVGAGPTGLALAADLVRRGIKTLVVDKNPGPSERSKALGVQAGTLESLSVAFGEELPGAMVAAGRKINNLALHFFGAPPVKIKIDSIPAPYDFILVLEQSETERFLEKYLNSQGGKVHRESEFLSAVESADGITSKIRGPAGDEKTVKSLFVIGCDGAHSAVRRELNFGFDGAPYDGTFLLADLEVNWKLDHETVRVFVSDDGALACFPFKEERKYRMIVVQSAPDKSAGGELTLDEFVAAAKKYCSEPFTVTKTLWLNKFRVSHRIVKKFRKERIFLAGDAAHIHSPVGGQGMNTGIQDALNLSSKLAAVIEGKRRPDFLEFYEKQRKPVAHAVLRATDTAFRFALSKNAFVRAVKRKAAPLVAGSRFVQKRVIASVSEIAVARREIADRKSME